VSCPHRHLPDATRLEMQRRAEAARINRELEDLADQCAVLGSPLGGINRKHRRLRLALELLTLLAIVVLVVLLFWIP
jgi:hypothetical protein